MAKKVVILGAGYAGVHAAKKLAKKYKKNNDVEIRFNDVNAKLISCQTTNIQLEKIKHESEINLKIVFVI